MTPKQCYCLVHEPNHVPRATVKKLVQWSFVEPKWLEMVKMSMTEELNWQTAVKKLRDIWLPVLDFVLNQKALENTQTGNTVESWWTGNSKGGLCTVAIYWTLFWLTVEECVTEKLCKTGYSNWRNENWTCTLSKIFVLCQPRIKITIVPTKVVWVYQ